MEKQIDFLAIGDIVAEPFIKIENAEEVCDIDKEHCKLCLSFGDKIPYESNEMCYAVGNASNAAVCASRLGLNTSIVSYIGDDSIGKENIITLMKENIHTEYVSIVADMPSNYHYVLWYEKERTILVNHTKFPYSFLANTKEPKWIYLSSLASNSTEYHNQISDYLDAHKNIKLAFQPGTFQIKLGLDNLRKIYERTDIYISNKDEARRVLNTEKTDIKELLIDVFSLGPKMVIITDSLNGAYAYDGTDIWFMEAYPQEPYERTGAGDAFSATLITSIIKDKSIQESLVYASINAMHVVQKVGPHKGLLSDKELEDFISNMNIEYKAIKLN